jgi:hypothetical protein
MEEISEVSTNRLLRHLQDDRTLAMISTYRSKRRNGDAKTKKENLSDLQELKGIVRNRLNLGFSEFVSRWTATDNDTNKVVTSDERSLMIYGISLKDAMELGKKYEQDSIIFKSKDQCAEVCTTPFMDYEGKEHKFDDVVRLFDVKSKTPLNLDMAKDIFENRIGGLFSKPVKGNRPFALKSVYEVEGPRPSVFSESEAFFRIF